MYECFTTVCVEGGMCVCHMHTYAVSMEARRGYESPEIRVADQCEHCVLGTEHGSSARAAHTLYSYL